jgi:uncharacterized protein YeaO (DUF488 family)
LAICDLQLALWSTFVSVHIVRLGTPRLPREGLRIGTVRRPPRGVPKADFSSGNWYDVWFPNLAPSVETMKLGLSAETAPQWSTFVRRYRSEMSSPAAKHDLELLAALSHTSDFSVGCYCEDESRCHRSVLRALLAACGAKIGQTEAGATDEPRPAEARRHS